MKLNIRSEIGDELNNIIQNKSNKKLVFRFGQKTRDNFIPSSSQWIKQCITGNKQKRKVGSFTSICEVGYVKGFWFILGQLDSDRKIEADVFSQPDCNIQITSECIQIEVVDQVTTLSELFNPVKILYGMLRPIFKTSVPSLLTPGLKIKNMTKIEDKSYMIMPLPRTPLCILVLDGTSIYLIRNSISQELHSKSSASVKKTILEGEWYDQTFFIYDSPMCDGKDIKKYTFNYRKAFAKRMTIGTSLCRMVSTNNNSEGIFIMKNQKYDEPVLLYRSPTNIGMKFKISEIRENGFQMFKLLLQDGSEFKGSKSHPLNSPIPLTRDDREFIQKFPTLSFEFRWYNDNLIPYSHVTTIDRTETVESNWSFLQTTFKNTTSSAKVLMNQSQRKNPLKMLEVNKSVVFYSPFEGDDVLVRTGTIGEGSCLFHALLHAYSKDYAIMDRQGRMKFVRRLRASMAGKVNIESWEDMGSGLISKIPFQENVYEILFIFYKLIGGGKPSGRSSRRVLKKIFKDSKPDELYKIISELLTFEEITSICLPTAYDISDNDKIEKTIEIVSETVVEFLNKKPEMCKIGVKKAEYILKNVLFMVETVLSEAKMSAYRSYVKGLERVSEQVDTYTIQFISDRFDRDVYFIDGTSRIPYNNCPTTKNIKDRKSMFVLWVGGNHYEIIGRLLPGNRIQREFTQDDELVKRVKTFLLEPEKIDELYPEISEFLPKNYIKGSPIRRNMRDNNSDSDAYYDSSEAGSNEESESEFDSD